MYIYVSLKSYEIDKNCAFDFHQRLTYLWSDEKNSMRKYSTYNKKKTIGINSKMTLNLSL